MDDRETSGITGGGRECGGMKGPKTKATKSLMDTVHDLGQKSGVKVTDMSERGVRAIGLMWGVRRIDQAPHTRSLVVSTEKDMPDEYDI